MVSSFVSSGGDQVDWNLLLPACFGIVGRRVEGEGFYVREGSVNCLPGRGDRVCCFVENVKIVQGRFTIVVERDETFVIFWLWRSERARRFCGEVRGVYIRG